eukprot:CAMPEP_0115040648 /NCGR_PEP_ID=MMETSP0216-20121206/44953_1 /TAXON_ID=223996 /ORGANISM="Protocruzia adherens, Strain Boccale" /LENGTH=275 /DNA_ID=CAMNT_0002421927 /DNA_START=200 /DNA_END=1027 /DNA_ORIENTATION=-
MSHRSRTPTSPTGPDFLKALETMDHKKLDIELNKISQVAAPGHKYEFKSNLMRYDFNFNQKWLDAYSADYGTRWAKGKERLELGMTPEESYQHWDNVMNFALKNGFVSIVLFRTKGTNEDWKFGIGSHAFDFQTLHPPSYQPWADVFHMLFVDYYKGELKHRQVFFNNSTCRSPEMKTPAVPLIVHIYGVITEIMDYKVENTLIISPKLIKIYEHIKEETNVLRRVEFSDVYPCREDQKALADIAAMNLRHYPEEIRELSRKALQAYDKKMAARL